MPRTVPTGGKLGDVNGPLWWTGWHPVVTPVIGGAAGLALGNAIAIPVGLMLGLHTLLTMALFTVLGVGVGVLGWYRGTNEVNENYRAVLDAYRDGAMAADASVTTYTLVTEGRGSNVLVAPHRRYSTTYLVLGASSLSVYTGALDLAKRQPELDDEAIEIPYDQIRTVAYDKSALTIQTVRGDRLQYDSASEPKELLGDLRGRIRTGN